MCESYPIGDEFEGSDVFVPLLGSKGFPIHFNDQIFWLGPDNSAIRSFDESKQDYSRVIVYLEDGSTAPFKPADEMIMHELVRLGVPVELPRELDETDHEFMDGFMRVWTEDASRELGLNH